MSEVKLRKYLKDEYATKILVDKDCHAYLIAIIKSIIGEDLQEDNIHLKDIRINSKIAYKDSEADVALENDGNIINVEINYGYSKELDNKNMTYVCQLILGQTKPDKNFKYVKIKPCYQINICGYDIFSDNKFIYKSTLRCEENNKLRTNLITIYDINLEYLQNFDYTNIEKKYGKESLQSYLYLFLCENREEVAKVSEGSAIMKLVKEKIFSLEKDDLGWTREDVINKQLEDQIYSEGITKGRAEGETTAQTKIAINLIKKDVDLAIIAECSGLSLEELKKLKQNIAKEK